jgi:hypothetical protein
MRAANAQRSCASTTRGCASCPSLPTAIGLAPELSLDDSMRFFHFVAFRVAVIPAAWRAGGKWQRV